MNAQIDAMQKAADAQRQAILKQLEGEGFGIQTATKMNQSDTVSHLQNLAFDIYASPTIDKSNMLKMMGNSQNNFDSMVSKLGLNGLDGNGGFDYGINDQLPAPKTVLLLL